MQKTKDTTALQESSEQTSQTSEQEAQVQQTPVRKNSSRTSSRSPRGSKNTQQSESLSSQQSEVEVAPVAQSQHVATTESSSVQQQASQLTPNNQQQAPALPSNQQYNNRDGRQQHRYDNRGHQRSQQHSQKKQSNPNRMLSQAELAEIQTNELIFYAKRLGIIGSSLLSKDVLIRSIVEQQEKPEIELFVAGVLEKLPDGFGFLRFAEYDYVTGPDDVYVSPSFIRRHNLRTGDKIHGAIRRPKEGEKYFALQSVDKINDREPEDTATRLNFDRLTPLHPDQRFHLETNPSFIATRIMDIFTPIGKGQRGLIVAPPKVGKTMLLKEVALSLLKNHPEVHLIVLLIDERPEEVSDMKRTIKGDNVEIISSTFDESAERHEQVAEIVLEKAKRLVEYGKDVVILLDSLTRLARAYNTNAPTSGKVLTGGIDAHALQRPKRFFGAARKTEEAGSLTIIASAMVETGSRMDEVIYEEFKGTGNMELHLTRKLSNRKTFPAFDILASSTRRDDLLMSPDELNQAWILHRLLSTMNVIEGMEFIINKMKQHKTNEELFESLKKSGAGQSAGQHGGNNGHGGHGSGSSSNLDY